MFDLPVCLKSRGGAFAVVWAFSTDKKAYVRFTKEDIKKTNIKNITLRIMECIPTFSRSSNAPTPETMLSLAAVAKMILGCARLNGFLNDKVLQFAERCLQNLEDPRNFLMSPIESEAEDVRGGYNDEIDFEPVEPLSYMSPEEPDDLFLEMEGMPPSPPRLAIDLPPPPSTPKKNPKRTCRARARSNVSDTDDFQPKPKKQRASRKPKLATVREELNDNTAALDTITASVIPTVEPLMGEVENIVYTLENGGDLSALDLMEMEGSFADMDALQITAQINPQVNLNMPQLDDDAMSVAPINDQPSGINLNVEDTIHVTPQEGMDVPFPNGDVIHVVPQDIDDDIIHVVPQDIHDDVIHVVPQNAAHDDVTYVVPQDADVANNDMIEIVAQDHGENSTYEVETARRQRASSVLGYSGPTDLTNIPSLDGSQLPGNDDLVTITGNRDLLLSPPYNITMAMDNERANALNGYHEVYSQDERASVDDNLDTISVMKAFTPRKRRTMRPRIKKDLQTTKNDRDKRARLKYRKQATTFIEHLKEVERTYDDEFKTEWSENLEMLCTDNMPPDFAILFRPELAKSRHEEFQRLPNMRLPLPREELSIEEIGPFYDEETAVDLPPVDDFPPFEPLSRSVSPALFSSQPGSPRAVRDSPEIMPSQDLFTSQMSDSEDSEVGLLPGATYFLADHMKDIPTEIRFAEIDLEDECYIVPLTEDQIFSFLLVQSYAKKKILFGFNELFGHFDVQMKAVLFQTLTLFAGKQRIIMLPGVTKDDCLFCLTPDNNYFNSMKKIIAYGRRTGWEPSVREAVIA